MRLRTILVLLIVWILPVFAGCRQLLRCDMQCLTWDTTPQSHESEYCESLAAKIEYTDVAHCGYSGKLDSGPPRMLSDGVPTEFWDLSLEEALRIGLESSHVLRDLGGRILNFPSAVTSVFDPSITMSHPRLGEEAALAAFDAQWTQSATYFDGTQVFNNTALGGGATEVTRDGLRLVNQLTKTAATGTQFSFGSLTEYENSDAPFNLFPSVFNGRWEAQVRQPLLQGAGVLFNRISGPTTNVDISLTRGVLLARIDGDISMAQFEQGVRGFVNELETAYWRLYFAYRSLDTNVRARDLARGTWQAVKARYDGDLRGGEADSEAQAREQLYLFEQLVVTALNGVEGDTGIYQSERQLRRMMGLPVNDGQLIRPADEPTDAPVKFDWECSLSDALDRRVELRQQAWRVKQRELELLAARNFLLPRLDAIATYRVNGLGNDLIGGSGPNESLANELFSFGADEIEAGVQLSLPLGYRRELAGVRHSELNLSRARAILRDQEHLVSHNLGEALARLETTYETIRLAYNRMVASEQVVDSREAVFNAGQSSIQDLLEAQRRLADAQANYYRGRVSHIQAISNVHLQKGTLLAYNGVYLSEGGWTAGARRQVRREAQRYRDTLIDYRTMRPKLSAGQYRRALIESCGVPESDAELTPPPDVAHGLEDYVPPKEFLQPDIHPSWSESVPAQTPPQQQESSELPEPSTNNDGPILLPSESPPKTSTPVEPLLDSNSSAGPTIAAPDETAHTSLPPGLFPSDAPRGPRSAPTTRLFESLRATASFVPSTKLPGPPLQSAPMVPPPAPTSQPEDTVRDRNPVFIDPKVAPVTDIQRLPTPAPSSRL